MKTVVRLPFPPSVNQLWINGKHRSRAMSQRYETWIQEANIDLLRQRPQKVSGPVNVLYEFKEIDKRKRDLGNLLKAPEDLIVSAGIIEADDCTIVRSIDLRWSDEVEGVRITIESIFGEKAA